MLEQGCGSPATTPPPQLRDWQKVHLVAGVQEAEPSSETCLCLERHHDTVLPCTAGIMSNGMPKILCRL